MIVNLLIMYFGRSPLSSPFPLAQPVVDTNVDVVSADVGDTGASPSAPKTKERNVSEEPGDVATHTSRKHRKDGPGSSTYLLLSSPCPVPAMPRDCPARYPHKISFSALSLVGRTGKHSDIIW